VYYVLTSNTPGRRQLTNLRCKCENIALFFFKNLLPTKDKNFLTGPREGQKKCNKEFSNGESGRNPHLFLSLFKEPLGSKIALEARINGHDKLGSRCDISFYLYCCITIFKF
jgi:hypothetical protein